MWYQSSSVIGSFSGGGGLQIQAAEGEMRRYCGVNSHQWRGSNDDVYGGGTNRVIVRVECVSTCLS